LNGLTFAVPGPVHRVVRLSIISTPSPVWLLFITVDPQILRQGKLVNLKVKVVRRGKRHPPQSGSLMTLHNAFPSRDREVVQLILIQPASIHVLDGNG
jgi:hypothetical protein